MLPLSQTVKYKSCAVDIYCSCCIFLFRWYNRSKQVDVRPRTNNATRIHFERCCQCGSRPGAWHCMSSLLVYYVTSLFHIILFFSRPRSEGWLHHERTFSIYPCPLSFWLTLPRRVLSMSWCCPSRPCVAFLAFVHLALFLALSLSPVCFLIVWP